MGEPVGVDVGETEAVFVELKDCEPELEAEAPGEREAVGVPVTVELPLIVDEAVKDPVPVPLGVEVCVGVGVEVTGGVALLEKETEGVSEADAPADKLEVGDSVGVVLSL